MSESLPKFTADMVNTHTILIPTMLPMHFAILSKVLQSYGYKTEILTNCDQMVVQEGLRYTHNDMCYPAILVIGQFISAIKSGKYDVNKIALMISQTGGVSCVQLYSPSSKGYEGCRV